MVEHLRGLNATLHYYDNAGTTILSQAIYIYGADETAIFYTPDNGVTYLVLPWTEVKNLQILDAAEKTKLHASLGWINK